MLSLILGFLLGAVSVVLAEAYLLLSLLHRLRRKIQSGRVDVSEPQAVCDLNTKESMSFAFNKQGAVWVLESFPKVSAKESSTIATKEHTSKKEIVDVFPVKKHAKIKDHSLILTDSNGCQATIELVGCVIVAVSASDLSSRKWAKRYPIRIENNKSVIYNGSNTCYIYLETSWEKESWCKALRLASCVDKDRINKNIKLGAEFHHYLTSLNMEYPSFMKPFAGLSELTERDTRLDEPSSKVRLFLKKLAKKASKSGTEFKTTTAPTGREERKIIDKSRSTQDRSLASASIRSSTEKTANNALVEDMMLPLPSTSNHSDSHGQLPILSEADIYEKFGNDEGTLCWNLLFSRLFFDAKRSTEFNNFVHVRIQRMLSNMRSPSYVGGITCSKMDIGNLPPFVHNMRVLPMDMNEVWAMEADIEYAGGAILYIETRLEVREPDFQKGIVNASMDLGTSGGATSDLLEGIEYYGDQLKLSSDIVDRKGKGDEGDKLDGLKNSKSTGWTSTYVSRWKSMLNSLADQVSQVPLSLAIRLSSLRGTVRLHIKPPPSDQLWFGFTSMPDIEWNFDSSVGEHKITSSHVALLIRNRFKAAIRESLVLPNCECVSIPWMIAEKDDWVPRKDAPFIWVHQEASDSIGRDVPGEAKTKINANKPSKGDSPGGHLDDDPEKSRNKVCTQPPTAEPPVLSSSQSAPTMSVSNDCSIHEKSLEDLRTPLLQSNETKESCGQSTQASPKYTSREVVVTGEEQSPVVDDMKPKRVGRRARMMDLGKKMGEKLEEKRRHIEEKGRNIVEKMRGHDL